MVAEPPVERPPGRRPKGRHWLAAVVLLGAGLRFFPIWFGLPYLRARPDEETAVRHALSMLEGDLNPHFFHWPSLTFYTFAALFWTASWIRRAAELDPYLTDVETLLIARGFVALAGTITIVVLFHLVRTIADGATGLLAALLLAVAILHVRESHFAMTDVLMTLLVMVSLGFLVRGLDIAIRDPSPGPPVIRLFAAAGFTGGLAASTKYSAAAVAAAMGMAQLLLVFRWRKLARSPRAWLPAGAFMLAFALGFILATPYALLDFGSFAADLKFDFAHLSGGHGVDVGRGWFYHFRRSLPYGLGLATFIAAIVGIVPLMTQHRRHAMVLGAFATAFYALIGSGTTVFFRYILPLIPMACLSAAVAVRAGSTWIALRTGLSTHAAMVLLAALLVIPSLVTSAWFDILLAKTDTRVLAERWLRSRLQPEDTLHDAGSVYTQLDLRNARFHAWYFDQDSESFGDPEGRIPDWLVLNESPVWPYARPPLSLRRLAADKYVLVQMFRATRGRARSAVYDLQDAFFMPISGLSTVVRPGPTVLVYRRRGAPPISSRSDVPTTWEQRGALRLSGIRRTN